MTKIKLCGLRRACDMEYVNELMPEYVGFVFARGSKRYVSPEEAAVLRILLREEIVPVGVFVDECLEVVADLVNHHVIDAVQLHGREDEDYIRELRRLTDCTIIQAFRIVSGRDVEAVNLSSADYVLLDSGGGSGETFNWTLVKEIKRPYFLAGGLTPANVGGAIAELHPYGVDASSSLETDGYKDREKLTAFVQAVRLEKKSPPGVRRML